MIGFSPPVGSQRIPSKWTRWHNLFLVMLLLILFFGFLRCIPSVRTEGELPYYFIGGLVVSLLFSAISLLIHRRRLWQKHQLNLRLDGHRDDVFEGVLVLAAIVFVLVNIFVVSYNAEPEFQVPSKSVKIQHIQKYRQAGCFDLLLEAPFDKEPIYIQLEGEMMSFSPKVGDLAFIQIKSGRFGIRHISHLSLKRADTNTVMNIYPKPSK